MKRKVKIKVIAWWCLLLISTMVYIVGRLFDMSPYVYLFLGIGFVSITLVLCTVEFISFMKFAKDKWKENRK